MKTLGLRLYLREHPRSRAHHWTTYYGSGSACRRVTCVGCRAVVATSAATYPETRASINATHAYIESCAVVASYEARAATALSVIAEGYGS